MENISRVITAIEMPSWEEVYDSSTEKTVDLTKALFTESLDLVATLFPKVAVWLHEGKPIKNGEGLANRISNLNTRVDVYVAKATTPISSSNLLKNHQVLICDENIDDLTLKRSLFGCEGYEDLIKRMLYISSLLLTGAIATMGAAPLEAALLCAPIYWLASAYSYDTAFLEANPNSKEALLQKRQSEALAPNPKPKNLNELGANLLFYTKDYIPAHLRVDVITRCRVKPANEEGPAAPAEEKLEAPVAVETPEPTAPVEEKAEAPVIVEAPEPTAPVEEKAEAPVVVETPEPTAPVEEKTEAPVIVEAPEPTAPVEEKAEAPVVVETPEPIETKEPSGYTRGGHHRR